MWCVRIAVLCVLVRSSYQQHGKQTGPCTWENVDNSTLNLNRIGNTDGTPRWSDLPTVTPESDPNRYSLNPCHPFSMSTGCNDVTACRKSNVGDATFNIGDSTSSNMYYSGEEEAVVLEYSHKADDINYISRFVPACVQGPDQIFVQGVVSSTVDNVVYRFILLTSCACPNGCASATVGPPIGPTSAPPSVTPQPIRTQTKSPPSVTPQPIRTQTKSPPTKVTQIPLLSFTPPVTQATIQPPTPPKSISAGGVICIIFVCGLCAYFLIGAVYMFCFRGAKGKEIIPHVHFWLDLPVLILDGFSFVANCCRSDTIVTTTPTTATSDYDKI